MEINQSKLESLAEKYGSRRFMYTEYPHKSFWSENVKQEEHKDALLNLFSHNENNPLMFYAHIPYCTKPCFFCTCHFEITKDHEKIGNYLVTLSEEIRLLRDFIDKNSINPKFVDVHLGGGSPTILNEEEFDYLVENIGSVVNIKNLDEFALEIDPRFVDRERMKFYHSRGINRISFGIQDFDYEVQKAINRVQPAGLVENLITPDIRSLFKKGVSFDILCGLPLQTEETIRKTFEKIIEFSPDRVCFNYMDFAPKYAPHQEIMIDGRNGRPTRLPDNKERKKIFDTGLKILMNNGYLRTGYDHFAKPHDDLAKALHEGKMHWNYLGVTPGRYTNVIGAGPSATSTLGDYYAQNFYGVENHRPPLERGEFPVFRNHKLDRDDTIRRDVIHKLRNFFSLNYEEIERLHKIDFNEYFKEEKLALDEFRKDRVLDYDDRKIEVTDLGREFILFVCGKFDKYFRSKN